MRSIRSVVWCGLSFVLVSSIAACSGATPSSEGGEAETEHEASAITMHPPPASTVGTDVAAAQTKRCVTAPKTFYGYGYGCPGPQHAAAALCSLDPQFNGGFSIGFDCQGPPGSNGLYTYTLTYECTRPQPCR